MLIQNHLCDQAHWRHRCPDQRADQVFCRCTLPRWSFGDIGTFVSRQTQPRTCPHYNIPNHLRTWTWRYRILHHGSPARKHSVTWLVNVITWIKFKKKRVIKALELTVGQKQRYPVSRSGSSEQVAPFEQGDMLHSDAFLSHLSPVNPCIE